MDFVGLRDPKSYFTAVSAAAITSVSAGTTTAVDGAAIDLVGLGLPQSLVFLFQSSATLTAGATLSLSTLKFQTSSDGTTWTDYTDSYRPSLEVPGVVSTGATGGSTEAAVTTQEVFVGSADRYFRAVFTPALSATSTDTATVAVCAIAAGFAHNPQS